MSVLVCVVKPCSSWHHFWILEPPLPAPQTPVHSRTSLGKREGFLLGQIQSCSGGGLSNFFVNYSLLCNIGKITSGFALSSLHSPPIVL